MLQTKPGLTDLEFCSTVIRLATCWVFCLSFQFIHHNVYYVSVIWIRQLTVSCTVVTKAGRSGFESATSAFKLRDCSLACRQIFSQDTSIRNLSGSKKMQPNRLVEAGLSLVRFIGGTSNKPRWGQFHQNFETQTSQVIAFPKNVSELNRLIVSSEVMDLWKPLDPADCETLALNEVQILAPLDLQEVWGAGVTYYRSKIARQEESKSGGSFYDLVYSAERPELFFKATPHRTVGPEQPVRVRKDTVWCVPEPELALVFSSELKLVGFTIGNDMSARDIEGENPLYLPQAKLYDSCCALGPAIIPVSALPSRDQTEIRVVILRNGNVMVDDRTTLDQMKRSFEELAGWLERDNSFPHGVVLLTGTGIVPPDEFSLEAGDVVSISITGIGTLTNPVVRS